MVLQIVLSNGMQALVSEEDHAYLSQFKWHASKSQQPWQRVPNTYACRFLELPKCPKTGKRRRRKVYMHREVLARMGHNIEGLVADHITPGNTLDNRRENLRPATHKENLTYSCGADSVEW